MNPEVKEKWLEALRSGEYEQGEGYLNCDGKLCCLGVLCEVAIKQGVDLSVARSSSGAVRYDDDACLLSIKLQEWSGVSEAGMLPLLVGEHDTLTELNDAGASFADIANVIEKHL